MYEVTQGADEGALERACAGGLGARLALLRSARIAVFRSRERNIAQLWRLDVDSRAAFLGNCLTDFELGIGACLGRRRINANPAFLFANFARSD